MIIYGILQVTREKALRKEGNDNDKIACNWFVPAYILGAVSVFT